MRLPSWFSIAVVGLAALVLGACGGSSRALVNAASRDLGCPRRHIRVVALERNVRGVVACNQRATYVRNCGRGRCNWTLDMRYMTYWR
ncbi:MAG: hypothetical protein AB8I08_04500 [Sandaracinaceae bacterium]